MMRGFVKYRGSIEIPNTKYANTKEIPKLKFQIPN
jgi:hypothetical protein